MLTFIDINNQMRLVSHLDHYAQKVLVEISNLLKGARLMNEERLGISVDEARRILGIGRNLMLELVKLDGFPAVRFKRKIIINKELMIKWFAENSGKYDGYKY